MKNLKLLAASIVAGSLLSSASQAAKIGGAYINLGVGASGFPAIGDQPENVNAKSLSATSVVFGAEYIYNYEGIIASLDLGYRFLDLSTNGDTEKKDVEAAFYGLGGHQFLGKFNIGYELVDGFAFLVNVGMTVQGADKSEKLVQDSKKMLSNIGFTWGVGVRYALSKNWSVRGDLGFNSVSMTKDLKDAKATNGVKSLDYKTTTFAVSYNF